MFAFMTIDISGSVGPGCSRYISQLCGEVSKVPVPVVDCEATSWISCTVIGWNSGNFQIFDCHLMLDF